MEQMNNDPSPTNSFGGLSTSLSKHDRVLWRVLEDDQAAATGR